MREEAWWAIAVVAIGVIVEICNRRLDRSIDQRHQPDVDQLGEEFNDEH